MISRSSLPRSSAAGILDFGTSLHNPHFAGMAEAAGLLGLTAEAPEQVGPMIGQALEHDPGSASSSSRRC